MYYLLGDKNKYYTLYTLIRKDILDGKFRTGEKLPSKRALASDLGVSEITVQLAYELLADEGYVTSRERSGYFVGEIVPVPTPAPQKPYPIKEQEKPKFSADFVNGSPPAELFPFSVWAKLMRGVLSDCGERLLERVPCDGDFELKEEISALLYRTRGIDADPRYVVIGGGAEYLYGIIVQLLGRDKLIAVENPGYKKISSVYSLNGAKTLPIDVTEAGIDLERLNSSGANVLHISPAHQFPTGVITSASIKSKLVKWASEIGGFVVEDDYDSEFRLRGKPVKSLYSLLPERVIYMNSFSKTLAPSMRLSYMILPPELYEKFIALFSDQANVAPLFEQKTLAAMLKKGHFERHINRLKNRYGAINSELKAVLKRTDCKIFDTGGGPHFLCNLGVSDEKITSAAQRAGINIKLLSNYLIAPPGKEQSAGCEGWAVISYSSATPVYLKRLEEFILSLKGRL